MSDKSLYEQLAASVGPMQHLPNNGAAYHTGEQIVTHLNRVLGPENWSFHILDQGMEDDSDECWVFAQLTAVINGATVVKQDYGSQAMKRARSTGKCVSKWNDKKAAATDALKRCARLLGVGLDAWAREGAPSWLPDQDVEPAPKNEPTPIRKANAQGSIVGWNAAVKNTRFSDDETAGKFVDWFTNGAYTTLREFVEGEPQEQVTALIDAVTKRIAYEAEKKAGG